jgi:hypothetical protein
MITKQPGSKTFVLLRVLRGSSCPQLTWTIGRCLGSSTARRSTSWVTGAAWSQTPTKSGRGSYPSIREVFDNRAPCAVTRSAVQRRAFELPAMCFEQTITDRVAGLTAYLYLPGLGALPFMPVRSDTSSPRAVARSIWWSCSSTRICRICSAKANSPRASHCRTLSR